jgi:hypothetical protein
MLCICRCGDVHREHGEPVRLTIAIAVALVGQDRGAISPATWVGLAFGALVLLAIKRRHAR